MIDMRKRGMNVGTLARHVHSGEVAEVATLPYTATDGQTVQVFVLYKNNRLIEAATHLFQPARR